MSSQPPWPPGSPPGPPIGPPPPWPPPGGKRPWKGWQIALLVLGIVFGSLLLLVGLCFALLAGVA
jgi:hypothetical protein